MPFGLTPAHLILVLAVVLIVVGPGKLPETGQALGKAIRGFREGFEGREPGETPNATNAQAQPPAQPYQPYPQQYAPYQQPSQPYPQQPSQYPQQPAQYPQQPPQYPQQPQYAGYGPAPQQPQQYGAPAGGSEAQNGQPESPR